MFANSRAVTAMDGMATQMPWPKLYRARMKRILDITLALALLPLLGPVIAVLWLLVRRDGGSGLFLHRRVGKDGQTFDCLKLRTMVPNAKAALAIHLACDAQAQREWARAQKLSDDPRVTRLGRVLRRTSLDELPQIFNVLRGDMSFVGPRPVTSEELMRYGGCVGSYLAIRPGITGLWQVSGRSGVGYAERVSLDFQYEQSVSLFQDLRILARTTSVVLGGTGV
ncbi:MAG: sugar transferase [Sedimentitalea sp.]